MTFRALLPRNSCQARLQQIFPPAAFDPVASNLLAASAVAAMVYVDAIIADEAPFTEDVELARPTTILWMCDNAFLNDSPEYRKAWRAAARRGKDHIAELLRSWGTDHKPWYADNSRETLRDETFDLWETQGAIRCKAGIPTTSSKPRWALTASFADLFNPRLTVTALTQAIERWQSTHMGPGEQLRILHAHQRERSDHAVTVTLPDGQTRLLQPGDASRVLKGVIEEWAPARLTEPVVLTISEPGDKVHLPDRQMLARLGVVIDAGTLLPDAVIADVGTESVTFWIVEAVATDGPVSEGRKSELLAWAESQRIPPESCQLLSAFLSRNHASARKRLKDLATGTFAWYADEPTRELAWYELDAPG